MRETAEHLAKDLEEDGFVIVRDFLDPDMVRAARDEIDALYRRDVEERRRQDSVAETHDGAAGRTILRRDTHLMLDVYGKSPTLDALFEKVLSDPMSSELVRRLAGQNLKLRGYNIKRMTGNPDPRPSVGAWPIPHEWHTDSPSEICIAIYLDDFSQPDNGTTALIRGSHLFPFCPRWNCLFGPIIPILTSFGLQVGPRIFLKFGLFSRLLARRLRSRETGAYGKRGDFYLFINDVWHGREPNIHGHDYMMLMVGAFPAEAEFPDEVKVPSAEVLAALPTRLRNAASQSLPANTQGDTILHRMRARRMQAKFPDLFFLARMERAIADACSLAFLEVKRRLV